MALHVGRGVRTPLKTLCTKRCGARRKDADIVVQPAVAAGWAAPGRWRAGRAGSRHRAGSTGSGYSHRRIPAPRCGRRKSPPASGRRPRGQEVRDHQIAVAQKAARSVGESAAGLPARRRCAASRCASRLRRPYAAPGGSRPGCRSPDCHGRIWPRSSTRAHGRVRAAIGSSRTWKAPAGWIRYPGGGWPRSSPRG